MDPFTLIMLISSVLSAGTGVFQNFSNRKAQKDANTTNLSIARETNEQNYQIWQESKEYNSPSNQVAMMRAAGINPITAYGGIQSGNKATPISMERPEVFPVMNDFTQVAQSLSGIMSNFTASQVGKEQAELLRTQVDEKKFENEMNSLTKEDKIIKSMLDNKLISADVAARWQSVQESKVNTYLKGMTTEQELLLYKEKIANMKRDTDNKAIQGDLMQIEKAIQEINRSYTETLKKKEVTMMNKQIAIANKSIERMQTEIDTNFAKMDLLELEKLAKDLDIKLKEYDVEGASEEIILKRKEIIAKEISNQMQALQHNLNVETYEANKKYFHYRGEEQAGRGILENIPLID